MLAAIHKNSQQPITIARLLSDLEWIGREKEDFISPRSRVINWDRVGERDVKVIFVRESIDGRRAHFRIQDDVAIGNNINESDDHKKAKEGIYFALLNDEIKLSFGGRTYFPSELDIKDITLETPTNNSSNAKILDVCLMLKEFHPILGNGIAFEIQFSNQTIVVEEIRTYHRVSDGYSCVWLKKNDFNGLNKLNQTTLEITPFRNVAEMFEEKKKLNETERLNELGRIINRDKLELENLSSRLNFSLKIKREELEDLKKEINSSIEECSIKYKEEITSEVFNQLNKELIIDLKRVLKEKLEEDSKNLGEYYSEEIKEKIRHFLEESNAIESFIKSTIELERDDLIRKIKDEALRNLSPEVIEKEFKEEMQEKYFKFRNSLQEMTRSYESFVSGDVKKVEFWIEQLRKKEGGDNLWKKSTNTQKKE
jgi:hypothetical protein